MVEKVIYIIYKLFKISHLDKVFKSHLSTPDEVTRPSRQLTFQVFSTSSPIRLSLQNIHTQSPHIMLGNSNTVRIRFNSSFHIVSSFVFLLVNKLKTCCLSFA